MVGHYRPHKIRRALFPLLLALAACGGGGGGSGPPANQAPIASAGPDQAVSEGATVTLDGSASADSDGTITGFAWAQTGGSPMATLQNPNTTNPTFIAPGITADTVLTFTVTVTDNRGATAQDTVAIAISNNPNQAPTADAGADQSVAENTSVVLSGSGSDADGSIGGYQWAQTGGSPTVTLSNANTQQASFTAPAVTSATPLTFTLTVTDNESATATDNVTVTVNPATVQTLSGTLRYAHVPHDTLTNGLNYFATTQDPIRGATVQLLNAAGMELDRTTSDDQGAYSFAVQPNQNVRVRVRAETTRSGSASWTVRVIDNTNGGALYVLDGALASTGSGSSTRDLTAPSGWSTTAMAYNATRASAPFAILESVYAAIRQNLDVDSSITLPPLDINWSVGNQPTDCPGGRPAGCIGTSFYDGFEIYILGAANNDTDEFDGHIVVHEWGHYFERKLSRSDSMGGSHAGGDRLDIRVAMGEGFGNAYSGIVTGDPFYRDSSGARQSQGFSLNVESNNSRGWFSESTVQALIYDLFDGASDGNDNIELGWAPLYAAFTAASYRDQDALSSIFSFLAQLRVEAAGSANAINTLAAGRGVNGSDAYGSGETQLPVGAGSATDLLPVYTTIGTGGTPVRVCSINTYGTFNKLSNRRYLRATIPAPGLYRLRASGAAAGDPDLRVYRGGQVQHALEAQGNEDSNRTLSAGTHIIEVYDYCNIAPGDGGCPADGNSRYCIDVTIN